MISDHIKYLKTVVEQNIVKGIEHVFANKFFEVYPPASTIIKSVPCACLRYLRQMPKKNGTMDGKSADETTVTKVRKLYDLPCPYQVDFYSKDIFDFVSKDDISLGWLDQLSGYVAEHPNLTGANRQNISVECGPQGIIDDENLILDGIYKGFCQVQFGDGIYNYKTIPRITGCNFEQGEAR